MIVSDSNITYNIDKLPLEAVALIYFLLQGKIEGFENAYMVEIKIDDPLKHIKEGNDFFIIYQNLDQYKSRMEHFGNMEWAVIHNSMFKNVTTVDEGRFELLLKNYFETGEEVKNEETNGIVRQVRRKTF